jgi:hypothetical protein
MMPKKVKTVCVPLDPDDCGSVIHGYVRFPELYRTHYGKKLWEIESGASLSLSDCNRVIQWALTDTGFNIEKLDNAIGALQKMRKHMVKAQAELEKLKAEKRARNLALDPTYDPNED